MSVGQPAHELRFLLHGTRTTETVPFTRPPNLNQASAGAIHFIGHLLLLEHVEFEANTASDAAAPQALYSHPVGSGSAIISHCTFFNHSSPLVDYARTTIHCVSSLFHPGTTLRVVFSTSRFRPCALGQPLGEWMPLSGVISRDLNTSVECLNRCRAGYFGNSHFHQDGTCAGACPVGAYTGFQPAPLATQEPSTSAGFRRVPAEACGFEATGHFCPDGTANPRACPRGTYLPYLASEATGYSLQNCIRTHCEGAI